MLFDGPKSRINTKFKNGLNEAADIVTKNLTKRLVNLRRFSLTAQPVTELRLDHAEGGFDIASFVIALQEKLLVELIVGVHFPPQRALAFPICLLHESVAWSSSLFHVSPTIALERNVRHGVVVRDYLQIRGGEIRLVRADFLHREVCG